MRIKWFQHSQDICIFEIQIDTQRKPVNQTYRSIPQRSTLTAEPAASSTPIQHRCNVPNKPLSTPNPISPYPPNIHHAQLSRFTLHTAYHPGARGTAPKHTPTHTRTQHCQRASKPQQDRRRHLPRPVDDEDDVGAGVAATWLALASCAAALGLSTLA